MRGPLVAASLAVILGAPLALNTTGFSFDTRPGSIYRADHSMINAWPRPPRRLSAEKIVDDRGLRNRANSYFDEFLGRTCSDVGIFKTCR